jgi:hypothetical protein
LGMKDMPMSLMTHFFIASALSNHITGSSLDIMVNTLVKRDLPTLPTWVKLKKAKFNNQLRAKIKETGHEENNKEYWFRCPQKLNLNWNSR